MYACVTQCVCNRFFFIVNVLAGFTVCFTYNDISRYVYKSMLNKRWITLPVVYRRPFASKTVFWAILKDFELALYKILQNRSKNRFWEPLGHFKVVSCVELYYGDVLWDAIALPDDAVVSLNSSKVQFEITPTRSLTQLQNG